MTLTDAVIIVLAGMGAGMINTVVGSGSLITFPTLIALGYPPVLANVSNNIGLVPGALSGVFGYRRELVGQRRAWAGSSPPRSPVARSARSCSSCSRARCSTVS